MPKEPLHVFIEGPPEVIARAEAMVVEDLLRQAEAAPLMQHADASAESGSNGLPKAINKCKYINSSTHYSLT
jgi:hypothetical protein